MERARFAASRKVAAAEISTLADELIRAIRQANTQFLDDTLSPSAAVREAIEEVDCRYEPEGSTALSVAIHLGQVETLKRLLSCSAPLSFPAASRKRQQNHVKPLATGRPDRPPKDPSTIAVRALFDTKGDGERLFYMLLDHGLQLSDAVRCKIGRYVWFWAVRRGYISVVEAFLDSGFPVDLPAPKDNGQHISAHSPGYDWLAESDTNAVWNASKKGRSDILKMLINRGASISWEKEDQGVRNGDSTDCLLAACHAYANDRSRLGLLHANGGEDKLLTARGYYSTIETLLAAGANPDGDKGKPVIIALAHAQLWKTVDLLLEHGADIYASSPNKESLAHCAVRSCNRRLLKLLFDNGLDVNTKDSCGIDLLQTAIISNEHEVFRFLLEQGANVNYISKSGISTLILAIKEQREEMIEHMIKAGADVQQSISFTDELQTLTVFNKRKSGLPLFFASTPLMAAVNLEIPRRDNWEQEQEAQSRVVQILLRNGAIPTTEGFIKVPARVKAVEMQYPISVAILRGHVQSLRDLLDAARSNLTMLMLDHAMRTACVTKTGLVKNRTPYLFKGLAGDEIEKPNGLHTSGQNSGLPAEEVELLLNAGASPNLITSQGVTPLHIACAAEPCQPTMVRRLIECGADHEIPSIDGKTAAHYAAAYSTESLSIILDAGSSHPIIFKNLDNDDSEEGQGWEPVHYACAGPKGFNNESYELLHEDALDLGFACALQNDEVLPLIAKKINGQVGWVCRQSLVANSEYTHESPVHTSCKNESHGPLQVICQKCRPWYVYAHQTDRHETPMILAAKKNSVTKVDVLLKGIRLAYDDGSSHEDSRNGIPMQHTYSYVKSSDRFQDQNAPANLALIESMYPKVPDTKTSGSEDEESWYGSDDTTGDLWGPSLEKFFGGFNPKKDSGSWGTCSSQQEDYLLEASEEDRSDSCNESDDMHPDLPKESNDDCQKTSRNPTQKSMSAQHEKGTIFMFNRTDSIAPISSALLYKVGSDRDPSLQRWEAPTSPTPSGPKRHSPSHRQRSLILNSQTSWGWTALHHAADHGNDEILKMLVAEPNIDLEPPTMRAAPSPLALAKASKNSLAVTILKDAIAARKIGERKSPDGKAIRDRVMSCYRWCLDQHRVLAFSRMVACVCGLWLSGMYSL